MADKKTILFIEDDNNIRAIVSRRLEEGGLEVVAITRGGDEALDAIKKGQHDLLLLDMALPVNDEKAPQDPKEGFRILEKINDMPEAIKKIPILVYSNFGDSTDVEKSLKLGAKDHLIKSNFTPTEVLEKIKGYLK